jgi:hypothetical protein
MFPFLEVWKRTYYLLIYTTAAKNQRGSPCRQRHTLGSYAVPLLLELGAAVLVVPSLSRAELPLAAPARTAACTSSPRASGSRSSSCCFSSARAEMGGDGRAKARGYTCIVARGYHSWLMSGVRVFHPVTGMACAGPDPWWAHDTALWVMSTRYCTLGRGDGLHCVSLNRIPRGMGRN